MEVLTAVLAPDGFVEEALKEARWRGLEPEVHGRLLLFRESVSLAWAAAHWKRVELVPIRSISDGARQLKSRARRWRFCSIGHHRRGSLIEEQLRSWKRSELKFPEPPPSGEGGVYALLSPDLLAVSTEFDRPDPEGVTAFEENKCAPSRAYLKHWEALTLAGRRPRPGERCLDLGASPGGWTWVLAGCGARVLSVDRAPLAPEVAAMPGVEFRQGDAFQMLPEKAGPVDWLVSDVICYPDKLFEFVRAWVESRQAKNMVCTIKFQGEADPHWVGEFEKLGRVLHLHHNKHELTWIRTAGR